uniref:Myb_CC_LHEQLE domain-containing protein n=1 Tax=Angiostrongylus cantonensis TaxID=6313 RepID=A0A0K0DB08_ANGCA
MPQGRKVKLAQKQQRMLSAKMHEALRSFAAPLYERDEMGQLPFQDRMGGSTTYNIVREMKQEEPDETLVEMESQCEMMEIDMQVQTNGLETGLEQNWDVASSLLDVG